MTNQPLPHLTYAFDLESYLIQDDNTAPKPVAASWYCPFYRTGEEGAAPFLDLPGGDWTAELIADPDLHFVGKNIAYDILLMLRWHPQTIPFWIKALDEGRVWDTQIREQIAHLERAGGAGFPARISLADLTLKYLDKDVSADKKGDDIWRLKYGTLDGVPLEEWPSEATRYALDDAVHTWQVFWHQEGFHRDPYPTETLQNQAAVLLNAASVWGCEVDTDAVAQHEQKILARMEELRVEIEAYGIVGKGSKQKLKQMVAQGWNHLHLEVIRQHVTKAQIGFDEEKLLSCLEDGDTLDHFFQVHKSMEWQQFPPVFWNQQEWNPRQALEGINKKLRSTPRSPKGDLSTAEESIEPIFQYVEPLKKRVEFKHLEKMYSTYITPYKGKRAVHPRFKTLVTTGRTACEKPNLQNVPSEFRDIVRPRKGHLFGVVDYSAIEMGTLAATLKERLPPNVPQLLLQAINDDYDLHCLTAVDLCPEDIDYETMLRLAKKEKQQPYAGYRQSAKACFSSDTELLTPDGWQSVGDLCINWPNKKIAQVNPHNRSFSFVEPLDWVYREDETFLHFWHDGEDTLVTPDHKMLAIQGDGSILETYAHSYAEVAEECSCLTYCEQSGEFSLHSLSGMKAEVAATTGQAFCPSVPTGWVLTRRWGNKPVVHGNCNFGLPGGLGVKAFVAYAKQSYGVVMSEAEARSAIKKWKSKWRDVDAYLKQNADEVDNREGRRSVAVNNSGRRKANCIYSEMSNYPFQSLAADGAKRAMWLIWKEIMLSWFWAYLASECDAIVLGRLNGYGQEYAGSPLRDSHLVNFVHDEVVVEHPEATAQEAYQRQEQLMVEGMQEMVPGVLIKVEGSLGPSWEH